MGYPMVIGGKVVEVERTGRQIGDFAIGIADGVKGEFVFRGGGCYGPAPSAAEWIAAYEASRAEAEAEYERGRALVSDMVDRGGAVRRGGDAFGVERWHVQLPTKNCNSIPLAAFMADTVDGILAEARAMGYEILDPPARKGGGVTVAHYATVGEYSGD